MNRRVERTAYRLLPAACLTLGACAHSPPHHYYLLTPTPAPVATQAAQFTLAVGSTRIAAHLDRPQIVTRPSAHRLALLSGERWAEPLADNITRILADNLASRLGNAHVPAYPWRGMPAADCVLSLVINEFSLGPDHAVRLDAQWRLDDRHGHSLHMARATLAESLKGDTTEALVATHSAALARLADDIAQVLPGVSARCRQQAPQ